MKKVLLLFLSVLTASFVSCDRDVDKQAIQAALQTIRDEPLVPGEALGHIKYRVYNVKVDSVEGNSIFVSYSVAMDFYGSVSESRYSGAEVTRDWLGNYEVRWPGKMLE